MVMTETLPLPQVLVRTDRGRTRLRTSARSIMSPRGGQNVAGPARGYCGLAPIFRVASHADITARSTAPSLHCRPTRICRRLSVGVRQDAQSLAVPVNGPLVVNDVEVMTGAAIDGVGLAFTLEDHAAPHLASGALVRVLEDWCPPFGGYFLYYPSRRRQPAALSALIETLRPCSGIHNRHGRDHSDHAAA